MDLCWEHGRFGYARRSLLFEDFSIAFEAGRTVLLGPNGAGKSTLLAILASVLVPDGGMPTLGDGLSPDSGRHRRAYRSRVAWLPQHFSPFPGLTAREQVAYGGWLKGLGRARAWDAAPHALDLVGLAGKADVRASRLSGGQQRRLGLAGALIHDAEVVLLDEPTAGLDPAQRLRFREILLRLPPETIVVVATHQTEDVHESYDRVVVLASGAIPFRGSVADFVAGTEATADMRDRVTGAYRSIVAEEE